MDPHALLVLLLVSASLIVFVTDTLRYDAVAVGVVLILAATGTLSPPREAFAGFSSPAVVLVASMYAFAAAVSKSGITERLGQKLLGGSDQGEARLVLRVVVVSALLSSVLSNSAVVATLIPVLGGVSRRTSVPVSRLLMPLAFGSLLGGLLTVVATSKNIAVNGVLSESGAAPFGLLSFSLFGLSLLLLGALYFVWPGRRLLPKARQRESLSEQYDLPKFVTELRVDPQSTLIGRKVTAVTDFGRFGITLLGIVRDKAGAKVIEPSPYSRIRPQDLLVLQGEPSAILSLRGELGLSATQTDQGAEHLVGGDVEMCEAIVPAWSTLAGQTPRESNFRATTGLNILGIAKRDDIHPQEIADTRLEVGDNLLIQQGGFDRCAATFQGGHQIGFVKGIPQRLRANAGQQRMQVGGCGLQQVHCAKTARIVKGNAGAIVHVQNNMVVLLCRRMVMHKLAQRITRDRHSPGHSQMDKQ